PPPGRASSRFARRPGLKHFACNGLDIYWTFRVAREVAEYVRTRKKPAFLHVGTVRLYGHAGADVPTPYLSREEVEAEEANDPLLHAVRLLREAGALTPAEALAMSEDTN